MRLAWILVLAGCTTGAELAPDCSNVDYTLLPTARGEASGVWDEARDRMVFFGGDHGTPVQCQSRTEFLAETWAFHTGCDNFEDLTTGDAPPARGRHATALDGAGERMIIHGGRYRDGTSGTYTLRGDTWAFDLATDTWSQIQATGPFARTNHVAVVSDGRFIIYGGNRSTSGATFLPLADVWSLDLATEEWAQQTTSGGTPGARLFHAATVSPSGDTMYVYGGGGANAFFGPFFGDLWALDLDTWEWTELHDGTGDAPLGRIWAGLEFDTLRNRLILVHGHDDGALGNTNQLWAFNLGDNTWSLIDQGDVHNAPANGFCDFPEDFVDPDLHAPERRNAHVTVNTGTKLLVFGGKSDCGLLDDVWSADLLTGRWRARSRATSGEICQRAFDECSTLCF